MNSRIQLIAIGAIALAALLVLVETAYFASIRPGYSHISNTISELGETGAPHAEQVSFGFFLPAGLLVWLALGLMYRGVSDRYVQFALIAMSSLGAGYAVAAFFPCDPGGPLFGTWRTEIHNIVGFIDYAGTGVGFLLFSRHFAERNARRLATAFTIGGTLLLLSVGLLAVQVLFPIRGAIQRVAEVIQFGGVIAVCNLLPRAVSPKPAPGRSACPSSRLR